MHKHRDDRRGSAPLPLQRSGENPWGVICSSSNFITCLLSAVKASGWWRTSKNQYVPRCIMQQMSVCPIFFFSLFNPDLPRVILFLTHFFLRTLPPLFSFFPMSHPNQHLCHLPPPLISFHLFLITPIHLQLNKSTLAPSVRSCHVVSGF